MNLETLRQLPVSALRDIEKIVEVKTRLGLEFTEDEMGLIAAFLMLFSKLNEPKDLDPEFEEILYNNLWDLYV
jgi:hypothetical protein